MTPLSAAPKTNRVNVRHFYPGFRPFLSVVFNPPPATPIRAHLTHRTSPSTIQTPIARRDRDSLADIASRRSVLISPQLHSSSCFKKPTSRPPFLSLKATSNILFLPPVSPGEGKQRLSSSAPASHPRSSTPSDPEHDHGHLKHRSPLVDWTDRIHTFSPVSVGYPEAVTEGAIRDLACPNPIPFCPIAQFNTHKPDPSGIIPAAPQQATKQGPPPPGKPRFPNTKPLQGLQQQLIREHHSCTAPTAHPLERASLGSHIVAPLRLSQLRPPYWHDKPITSLPTATWSRGTTLRQTVACA